MLHPFLPHAVSVHQVLCLWALITCGASSSLSPLSSSEVAAIFNYVNDRVQFKLIPFNFIEHTGSSQLFGQASQRIPYSF